MELRQLRTFVAVVDCSSFSRAAEELNLTQPAVTAQIQALERDLGARLLERLPRQVLLTPAGEALLPYARGIVNLEREGKEALAALQGLRAGCLRVGASPTIGTYLLPQVLGEFKRRYPGLRVIAEIEPSQRVAEALAMHALDLGLVEAPVQSDALEIAPFLTDEMVLAVPAGHPWAGRSSIRLEELAHEPMIVREPTSSTRRLVEGRLRAAGVEAQPALELGGIEAIKNAVAAGLGVTFISRVALSGEGLQRLVVVPVEGLDLRRPLYRLLHKQRQATLPARALLDLLAELA